MTNKTMYICLDCLAHTKMDPGNKRIKPIKVYDNAPNPTIWKVAKVQLTRKNSVFIVVHGH